MAGTRGAAAEPPRSTAYYYADLERLKRGNGEPPDRTDRTDRTDRIADDRGDGVVTDEVVADGPVAEVPPLRDRRLPERKPEETYSTAGTFPMPEPKEKEPLLAELEVVGRLPLTQLDSTSTGVRRSRSWYLCCPNIGEEEISRESSWRYSSLRPVTAPPIAGQNGLILVGSDAGASVQEEVAALRGERDALAAALAAERRRAAEEARAHDARLAELHGVIAELVRRRAQDKCARAIPEEELSDECESTTQPAGELDNDADRSRTDQNDTSSLSACDAPSPPSPPRHAHQPRGEHQRDDTSGSSARDQPQHAAAPEDPNLEVSTPQQTDPCDTSVNYSERDSEICVSTARCCQYARGAHLLPDGCELPEGLLPPSPGRCESRQAKLAARVRLRRANDTDSSNHQSADEGRCQGDALLPCEDAVALHHEGALPAAAVSAVSAAAWRARCLRVQADCRVLDCALARALDTAHRLTCACAAQESSSVALCSALRAADRALETYDVLLALAETQPHQQHHQHSHERRAAEAVARRLLRRLEAAPALGEPLLSPGPWLQPHQHHHHQISDKECEDGECGDSEAEGEECGGAAWGPEEEARLRHHAARLKTETVALRALRPPPHLFSYHDVEEEGVGKSVGGASMADMEAAVMMQEVLAVREARAAQRAAAMRAPSAGGGTTESSRSRRRRERERHWLDSRASETDL